MEKEATDSDQNLFVLKKRMLLITFFVRYFFVGAEYSVILPTVLLYTKSLSGSDVFSGVVIAAYPLAAMISLPVSGYIYDQTKRTKELLLVLNGFQIAGNIIYSLPFSKWLPVVGRLLAGFGDGFIALVVGEVSYIYPRSSRIGILSILELGRVLGMTIGPILNFFLEHKSIVIGYIPLNNNTLPSAIMAICWIVMQVLTIFGAFNIAKEIANGETTYRPLQQTEDLNIIESEKLLEDNVTSEDEMILEQKTSSDHDDTDKGNMEPSQNKPTNQQSYWSSFSEILSIEFLLIFAVDLILWTSQTVFEVLLPYVTEFEYNWPPKFVGVIYMVGGVYLLFLFISIYLLGDKCGNKDTELLLLSLMLTQVALALVMYETIQKNYLTRVTLFCLVTALVFATIPFNLVCSKSLLTKIMRKELQGMVQGISSSISRIAMIIGPILSGVIFKRRRDYGAIASIFCYFTLVGLFCSLKRIARRQKHVLEEEERLAKLNN